MEIVAIFLLATIGASISSPAPTITSVDDLPYESGESMCRLDSFCVTPATEDWIRANPTYAHSIFSRRDEQGRIRPPSKYFAEHSLRVLNLVLGPYHPETLHMEHDLALALMVEGSFEEALAKLSYIAALEDRILGQSHPYTLSTGYTMAHCLFSLNRDKDSLLWAGVTLDMELQNNDGVENEKTMKIRNAMVYPLYFNGRKEEAETQNEKVMNWTTANLSPSHKFYLVPRNSRAYFLSIQDQWGEAKMEYEDLLKLCLASLGEDDECTLTGKMGLARSLWNTGGDGEAIELGEEVLDTLKRMKKPNRATLHNLEYEVGEWMQNANKLEKVMSVPFGMHGLAGCNYY